MCSVNALGITQICMVFFSTGVSIHKPQQKIKCHNEVCFLRVDSLSDDRSRKLLDHRPLNALRQDNSAEVSYISIQLLTVFPPSQKCHFAHGIQKYN